MPKEVKVYSTPACPWCKKAKQWLEENKITFRNLDVASDRVAREEMVKKTGQLAVPVIDIDGEIVVGYDEAKLKEKLGLTK